MNQATLRGIRRSAEFSPADFELSSDILVGNFTVHGVDLRGSFAIGGTPVLFSPIRLETRFFDSEMRVRMYPDQFHWNGHRSRLTRREARLGERYWRQWHAGKQDIALTALTEAVTPRRALWVARQTQPDVNRDGTLHFPTPKTGQRRKVATAELLPARWAVVGFVDNERRFVQFGSPIQMPLAFAPDFDALSSSTLDDDPMAWMIDYQQAVSVGMAVSIDLTGFDYGTSGLTLLVVGIGEQQRPHRALEQQLLAHRYTDGLSFIAQGTPTNNTDSTIAGWSASVTDVAQLFADEFDDEAPVDMEGSAAGQLSNALGLDDNSVLFRIAGTALDEVAAMAGMNELLWPVTWGRYLDDLLATEAGPSIVPQSARDTIRRFFIDQVRGGAPLPTLGVGAQPYPVLPIMRRDGGSFTSDDPMQVLEAILLDLRERFRESLPAVARLDPVTGGSSDDAVTTILGTLAHPLRFTVRKLIWQWALRTGLWEDLWQITLENDDYMLLAINKLLLFDSTDTIESIDEAIEWLQDLRSDVTAALGDNISNEIRRGAENILDSFIAMCEAHRERQLPLQEWFPDAFSGVLNGDVTDDPKIIYSGYGNVTEDEQFNHPLVSSPHATTAHYLNVLKDRTSIPIVDTGIPKSGSQTSLQAELSDAELAPPRRRRGLQAADLTRSAQRRSIQSAARERRQSTDEPFVDPDALLPLSSAFLAARPLLYQLLDAVVDDVPIFQGTSYRRAIDLLRNRSDDEIELRLRETLGIASHRLDVWLTAFASEKLQSERDAGKRALQLGAYGWVEGLRPDADGTFESQGFIHAPSITQATTAAVLRAGYHAHGNDDPDSLFAVDLRSNRVRTATWILDGIRQGQSLGDLLGCRFERRLHDDNVDQFIDQCRRRVLENEGISRQPRSPVDGLALAELYQSNGVRVDTKDGRSFTVRPAVAETIPERHALKNSLDDLISSMDSVADAAITDSLHHILQGNTTRASATLDAITTGSISPPELRALDTRYADATVSHRVMILLRPSDPNASGWGTSPRSTLEPALAQWCAVVLGDPSRIHCRARIRDSTVNIALTFVDLIESQQLSALDCVLDSLSNWQARVRAHVLSQPEFSAAENKLDLDFEPDIDSDSGAAGMTFADAAMLANAARELLGIAKPLDARDFATPGIETESGINIAEADRRMTRFRAALSNTLRRLKKSLPKPLKDNPRPGGDAPLAEVREALSRLANFGIGAPATIGFTESGRDALYAQAWSASELAQRRLSAFEELDDAASLSAKTHALVGRGFPLLPQFSAPATRSLFDASEALIPDGAHTATDWLHDMSRVREALSHLQRVDTLGELLHDKSGPSPVVAQVPRIDDEPWVALHAPTGTNRARLALYAIEYGGVAELSAGRPAAGLLIDSWSDQVPGADTVTGVAVHHDSPTSRPPQALLLAVPPANRNWSFDHVIDTLLDTLEAAKLRSIDPDVLLAHGHQAPAIFPPTNIRSGAQEPNDG